MKNFKKYLPQTIILILESLAIWGAVYSRAADKNTQELKSPEFLIFIFITVVIGFGLAHAVEPKKTGQEIVDDYMNNKI